jgi:hypothetical protein
MTLFAGLSPNMENGVNVTVPTGGQGLHSRFNPKLIGFGIVNPFEPSSDTPADPSQGPVLPTSHAIMLTEILK